MKKIRPSNILEYYIVLAINDNCHNVKSINDLFSVFSKERVALTLASLNNRMLITIDENGNLRLRANTFKMYKLIGEGVEAGSFLSSSGRIKQKELKDFVRTKLGIKTDELNDVLSFIPLYLEEYEDE